MPLDFNAATSNITWSSIPAAENLTLMSITFLLNLDSFRAATDPGYIWDCYTNEGANQGRGWALYIGTSSEKIYFRYGWTGTDGFWSTGNNSISTGISRISLTYNAGAVGNDPVIRIDNVDQAPLTEALTPVGTAKSWASDSQIMGYPGTSDSVDGKIHDFRIYDQVLATANTDTIYALKSMRFHGPVPVFRVLGMKATGLQSIDGQTLAAANTIPDEINGILGTPGNSPIIRDETYLAY
jgi:hypothetical protein